MDEFIVSFGIFDTKASALKFMKTVKIGAKIKTTSMRLRLLLFMFANDIKIFYDRMRFFTFHSKTPFTENSLNGCCSSQTKERKQRPNNRSLFTNIACSGKP